MTAAPAPATDADARFARLAADDWAWRLAEYPQLATSVGDASHDDRLERVDAASRAARLTRWRDTREALAAIAVDEMSDAARIDRAVFENQLHGFIGAVESHADRMPLNSDSSFYGPLVDLCDAQPLRNAADYRRYLARLAEIPRFMAEHTALLREGLATGYTVPQVVLQGRDQPLAAIAGVADPAATPFWKPFGAFPATVGATDQAALQAEARCVIGEQVLPAYRALLAFLRETYVPGARQTTAACDLPDGDAFYAAQIRQYTTLALTADEIHARGLEEVARILEEMQVVKQQAGFDGDLQAFLRFLRTDAQFYARTPQELLAHASWIAKRIDGLLPKFFGVLPRQPYGVAPVPDDIAPFYTTGRYVLAPQPDGFAGMYWVNTHALPSRALYTLAALTLHEAVPGHHLQIALAAEQAGQPAFRRLSFVDAYGEGWALYAEHLGDEMGVYLTPYEQFGRLTYEMWRAARLVVDTGLHARRWSREDARAYLLAHTALSEHEVATEVDRYISWPGQALSYKIGEIRIRELRARAQERLGARFDLRAFHDTVLALGSVPLGILEEQVDAWISRRLAP
ncbi:MAG: DUF885 family protein [Burkholderiaceae bacterium]